MWHCYLMVHQSLLGLYQIFFVVIFDDQQYLIHTLGAQLAILCAPYHQAATEGEIPIQVSCFVCRVSVLPCYSDLYAK